MFKMPRHIAFDGEVVVREKDGQIYCVTELTGCVHVRPRVTINSCINP